MRKDSSNSERRSYTSELPGRGWASRVEVRGAKERKRWKGERKVAGRGMAKETGVREILLARTSSLKREASFATEYTRLCNSVSPSLRTSYPCRTNRGGTIEPQIFPRTSLTLQQAYQSWYIFCSSTSVIIRRWIERKKKLKNWSWKGKGRAMSGRIFREIYFPLPNPSARIFIPSESV